MEATKIKIKGTSYDLADAGLDALKTAANATKSVIINSDGDGLSVAEKADLASPAFTGTPTAPTATTETDTTQIATTAFAQALVNSKIAESDALIYKGAVNSDSDLPYTTAKVGWTYKVATAGTYDSKACEIGDMLICRKKGTASTNAEFDAIQGNIDGAVIGPASSVDAHVAVFDGATGKLIKDSGALLSNYLPVSGGTATNLEVTGTLKADLNGNCSGSSESCNGLAASASTLTGLTATIDELNYTDGVTSNIQTQLNAKQATLSTTQLAAANSGITSSKVTTYDGYATTIAGKADKASITAGTYKSVTVNSSGIVTAGSNPTTLSGYGITDAKIASGVITLGSNTITPLTSHQDISGKANAASITAGTAGTSSATSGSSLAVPYVTMNAQGIVTGYGTHTHTVSGFLTSDSTLNAAKLSGTVPSGCYTNTTYSAGTGIGLSGTTFSNSGVRSIATGSSNGTISVNTNGSTADVAVKGLGSAAYTASTAYAASSHTHSYAGSSSAGGAATSANKVNSNLAINVNGGTAEGTTLYTFNGSAAKTIKLVPGSNVSITGGTGTITIASTNTTYSAGTGLSFSGTTINHASSVTAGTAGTSSATSGSTLAVPYVTTNASGHITGYGTHTHTVSGFATPTSTNFNGRETVGTASSGSISTSNGSIQTVSSSYTTITMPTVEAGRTLTLLITCTGDTLTWAGGTIYWAGGEKPSTESGVNVFTFVGVGSVWYGCYSGVYKAAS